MGRHIKMNGVDSDSPVECFLTMPDEDTPACELIMLDRAIESTKNRIHYLSLYKHSSAPSDKKQKQNDVQAYILDLLECRKQALISQGAIK